MGRFPGRRDRRGVTLVETLLYVAIFGVIVMALASFAASLIAVRLRSQAEYEVDGQGTRAVRMIAQALREAALINGPVAGSNASDLSLAVREPAADPTVFFLSGGALYMKEGSNVPIALTNAKVVASDLVFVNPSLPGTPGAVTFTFNLTSASKNAYAAAFGGAATLRK